MRQLDDKGHWWELRVADYHCVRYFAKPHTIHQALGSFLHDHAMYVPLEGRPPL